MHNKFYTLKPAVDTEETGNVFPAVESYEDYDFNAPDSVHKLNHHEFPDLTPNIKFKLSRGARFTDVMSQATINAYGLLISEELKNSLSELNIPPHKFYPASIQDKERTYNYYWLHIVWKENTKIIDYSKSSFFQKRGQRDLGDLIIHSENDYKITKEKLGSRFMVGQKEIVLKTIPDYNLWPAPYKSVLIIPSSSKVFFKRFTGISITENNEIKDQGLIN